MLATDTQVSDTLWTIHVLRQEAKSLTPESVFERQKYIFRYDQATIYNALEELSNRGYQWDKLFPGIPDSCIIIRHPGEDNRILARSGE